MASNPRQWDWRLCKDNAVTPSQFYAAQNTAGTLDTNTDIVRIRVLLANADLGLVTLTNLKIQYSLDNSTFYDMGASNHWNWANGQGTDGATIAARVLSTTTGNGIYCESSANSPGVRPYGMGFRDEFDFAITPTASVNKGDTYYFRLMYGSTEIPLFSGFVHPEINTIIKADKTVHPSALTMSLALNQPTFSVDKTFNQQGGAGSIYGNTHQGVTGTGLANSIVGSVFNFGGTLSTIVAYLGLGPDHPTKMKGLVYRHSDLALVGVTDELTTGLTTSGWKTLTFSSPPTISTDDYLIAVWCDYQGDGYYSLMGDATGAGHQKNATYGTPPNPLVSPTHYDVNYSIYCTTQGGNNNLNLTLNTPTVSGTANVYPNVQGMTLTLNPPAIPRSVYPDTQELVLELNTPTTENKSYVRPSAQSLTLSLKGPAVITNSNVSPATQGLILALKTPSTKISFPCNFTPHPQDLKLTLNAPTVSLSPGLRPPVQNLTLALKSPVISSGKYYQAVAQVLTLALKNPSISTGKYVSVNVQGMNLSLNTPAETSGKSTSPNVQGLILNLKIPSIKISIPCVFTPHPQNLYLTLNAPSITKEKKVLPSAQVLSLALKTPTINTILNATIRPQAQEIILTLNPPTTKITGQGINYYQFNSKIKRVSQGRLVEEAG